MTSPPSSGPRVDESAHSSTVTALLRTWSSGDAGALDQLIPMVYDQLRGIARRQLRSEASGQTLQPTAIVHEAYARMAAHCAVDWRDRRHFFAVASTVMRRILVDHARARLASKRGRGRPMGMGDDLDAIEAPGSAPQILAIDTALRRLESIDADKCQLVQLRFFGGFSLDETAEILGCSRGTIVRQWRVVRAWLYRELGRGDER